MTKIQCQQSWKRGRKRVGALHVVVKSSCDACNSFFPFEKEEHYGEA